MTGESKDNTRDDRKLVEPLVSPPTHNEPKITLRLIFTLCVILSINPLYQTAVECATYLSNQI